MRTILLKHKVEGTSRDWEIAKWNDGKFSCNCPAWIFHKGHKVDCKHILWFKQQTEVTIRIEGLNTENTENEAHKSSTIKENDVVNDLYLKLKGVCRRNDISR